MLQTIILACVTYFIAGIFMYVRTTNGTGIRALLLKTLASFSFVVLGIVVCFSQSRFTDISFAFLIIGLICGMLGDVFLDLKYVYCEHKDIYTSAGIISFSLGHLSYLGFVLSFVGGNMLIPLIISAGVSILAMLFIALFGKQLLKLNFGEFKLLSLAYTGIIFFVACLSVIVSITNGKLIFFAIGEGLILISDLVLSMIYFGGKENSKLLSIINHSLYYLGQILIACCLILL